MTTVREKKRYSDYIVRSPAHRREEPNNLRFGVHMRVKREAIELAQRCALALQDRTPVRNRRVSVYFHDEGKRPSLLYQCHVNRKTGRIVSEVL